METANLRRYVCRNNQSGPLAKITSISFLSEEQTIANANLSSLRLVLDDNVHKTYAQVLLPLAIDYSKGLINYFFRGQLDVGMSEGSWKVKNTSNETMIGGTFELYYDNESGVRSPVTNITGAHVIALAPGDPPQTITFTPPENASSYMLVYKGQLGNERDAVIGKFMDGTWEPWNGPLVNSRNAWQEEISGMNPTPSPWLIDEEYGLLHFGEVAAPATAGVFAALWMQTSIPIPKSELYFNISRTLTTSPDSTSYSNMWMCLVDDNGNNKTISFAWSAPWPPSDTQILIDNNDGKAPISIFPLTGHITFIAIGVNLSNGASGEFQSDFIDFK